MSEERKPNIGPQDLAAVQGSPFLLSRDEWYSIQRYVQSALQLPDTEPKMRLSLAAEKDKQKITYIGPFDEFKELLAGYQTVIPHVRKWQDKIFPDTVKLAQDISEYATKARVYYGALLKPIEDLLENPRNTAAQTRFAGICTSLAKDAADNEKRAKAVYADIEQFARDTSADEVLLKGLANTYDGKYGKQSAAMKAWEKEIAELRVDIEQLNKDYEHDCLVAETTPTYAWLGIFGLIIAAVVAGIYGSRAADLKRKIDEKVSRIGKLEEDTQRAVGLMNTLKVAIAGLADIKEKIAAALPSIQKIQGVWFAIGGNLTTIGKTIKDDIEAAEEFMKELGVELAIEQWQECKRKSDAYQAHAFIEVTEEKKAA